MRILAAGGSEGTCFHMFVHDGLRFELAKGEMASRKTRQVTNSLYLNSSPDYLMVTKVSHSTAVQSGVRLATISGNECTLGAR